MFHRQKNPYFGELTLRRPESAKGVVIREGTGAVRGSNKSDEAKADKKSSKRGQRTEVGIGRTV